MFKFFRKLKRRVKELEHNMKRVKARVNDNGKLLKQQNCHHSDKHIKFTEGHLLDGIRMNGDPSCYNKICERCGKNLESYHSEEEWLKAKRKFLDDRIQSKYPGDGKKSEDSNLKEFKISVNKDWAPTVAGFLKTLETVSKEKSEKLLAIYTKDNDLELEVVSDSDVEPEAASEVDKNQLVFSKED